jgi:hypothetical protein
MHLLNKRSGHTGLSGVADDRFTAAYFLQVSQVAEKVAFGPI